MITVNGVKRTLEQPLSVTEYLEKNQYIPVQVAIELNDQILARELYGSTILNKFNNHYQPIPVSSNVEYVMLITYVVSIRKVSSYIRKVAPFCFFRNLVPSFQSYF